ARRTDDVLHERPEGVAPWTLPEPPAGGITAVGARIVHCWLGHSASLGVGPDGGSVGFVSIRERLFAAIYDPLSAKPEAKFGAKVKRNLLANARGRVLEIGVGTG